MAINERDFYASHGISFDIEEMQIEYTKRVINQAKIEVLTEIQLEIEEQRISEPHNEQEKYWNMGAKSMKDICNGIFQEKINALKEKKNDE